MIIRHPENPLISPCDVKPSRPDFEVVCTFNAGVTRYKDEVILLLRVAEIPKNDNPAIERVPIFSSEQNELIVRDFDRTDKSIDYSDSRFVRTAEQQFLTSISHLRLARSKDGIHFSIDEKPAMFPANVYEEYGIEDARITKIDDTYYINYCGTADVGITTLLASTTDFETFERHGVIFAPDNKDVEIFPEKINGKYYALHRPTSAEYKHRSIWMAESPDLMCWGNHRNFLTTREGFWDDGRVGGSAVPFRIEEGWLEIYHGADKNNRYCLGALLLDADEPWKILGRSEKPIMKPEADYEVNGFFGNIVFNNGVLFEDGIIKIYYGAADTHIAYAEISLEEVLAGLK
ncbi:glycoside hydrolase family 130 protein [Tichowtungia aerotolerans]|uniref:Glycosidase n=1 Tax=Tichowtungia aerotolerans TaxID=2697043 RepID=A0A6P1MBZ8_9BACT|nr:glycoside hydrolase family 130 protein [Tichowtungia aerotolerans]QHI69106.1 glycosidase [Tichowtungia aerotolerans]